MLRSGTIKTFRFITGCALAQARVNGDSLEIGKWQNLTPHRIKTPGLIAKKIVMGGQVGEETRSAKFGADRSTGIFRGNMPNFHPSIILFYESA